MDIGSIFRRITNALPEKPLYLKKNSALGFRSPVSWATSPLLVPDLASVREVIWMHIKASSSSMSDISLMSRDLISLKLDHIKEISGLRIFLNSKLSSFPG